MPNLKNKKFYGITNKDKDCIGCVDKDIEWVKSKLNENFPILVELQVTKAYKRNPDLVEIEIK